MSNKGKTVFINYCRHPFQKRFDYYFHFYISEIILGFNHDDNYDFVDHLFILIMIANRANILKNIQKQFAYSQASEQKVLIIL